jgi:uroporphyrin-III C-methyltransferase/precorrin-2 dehydrogenase/sirohydrochlorin ferrochelatase
MSHPDHPLVLDLRGRPVLVVGAGTVGTRRVRRLLDSGAVVRVVAPHASEAVQAWAADPAVSLTWHSRGFDPGDVAGVWLVHAATGSEQVDAGVVAAAEAARIWSVRASDASASPAWSAATTTERDGVRVAVSAGRDPGRAVRVRDSIETLLATGSLPLRPRRRARTLAGSVALVGAGPGDPELVTLRGLRLLRRADVVVVDHLVPAALLRDLDPDVEVVYAGKVPGRHALTQQQINALLVDRARQGLHVVRLKGGDPFVLGRGGEEVLACRAAGVPVEVVPGITSAVAVPAAAGIPVTHRGVTCSFTMLSGHGGLPALLAEAAAAPPDATLVVLMGVRTLGELTAGLVALGRPASAPVAVVENGWTPQQRVVSGTLADIAGRARDAGVVPPAVVVVGEVVRLREQLGDLAHVARDAGHVAPDQARPELVLQVPA